jgi:hypothetical protein
MERAFGRLRTRTSFVFAVWTIVENGERLEARRGTEFKSVFVAYLWMFLPP